MKVICKHKNIHDEIKKRIEGAEVEFNPSQDSIVNVDSITNEELKIVFEVLVALGYVAEAEIVPFYQDIIKPFDTYVKAFRG